MIIIVWGLAIRYVRIKFKTYAEKALRVILHVLPNKRTGQRWEAGEGGTYHLIICRTCWLIWFLHGDWAKYINLNKDSLSTCVLIKTWEAVEWHCICFSFRRIVCSFRVTRVDLCGLDVISCLQKNSRKLWSVTHSSALRYQDISKVRDWWINFSSLGGGRLSSFKIH